MTQNLASRRERVRGPRGVPIDLVAAIGDAIGGRNSSNSSDAAGRVPPPSDKE